MSDYPPINATPLPHHPEGSLEWQQQRQGGVGSSDASIIMGLSEYESPYSLWEIKTGKAPLNPPRTKREEEILRFGHLLEPVTRQETANRLGVEIMKPDTAFHSPEREWQRCNLDGWTMDARIGEFKNTSFFMRQQWLGQVPDHAEVQVHHAAAVTGATRAIVAGIIGGNELAVYELDINPNVVDMITEAEAKFWEHVTSDTPPPIDGHIRTYQTLTRELAQKKGAMEVEAATARWLVQEYFTHKAKADEHEKLKRQAQSQLAKMFDGHEEIRTGRTVWAKTRRGQMNLKRLQAEMPELVQEYTRPVTTFDLEAFKNEQTDTYRKFQTVTVNPQKLKET